MVVARCVICVQIMYPEGYENYTLHFSVYHFAVQVPEENGTTGILSDYTLYPHCIAGTVSGHVLCSGDPSQRSREEGTRNENNAKRSSYSK